MTVSLKHLVTATGTDAGNGQIGKAQWNDEHTLTLASQKLLGRASSGSGPVEEIDLTAAGRALLDDADASEQRSTLGLGSIATQSANGVAITGGTITGITDLAVVDGGTGASDPAGARANLGLGSLATLSSVDTTQITNSAVTYAKIQNVTATDRILGRSTAGAGVVEEIICTAAGRALLDDANAAAQISTLGLSASGGSNSIGFLQAGTGAVARTVQSKEREIFSVKDFGAVGNGIANDTAAIQAAFDAAKQVVMAIPTYGITVYFPRGVYLVTSTITIPAYCNVVGENTEGTIISASFNGDTFTDEITGGGSSFTYYFARFEEISIYKSDTNGANNTTGKAINFRANASYNMFRRLRIYGGEYAIYGQNLGYSLWNTFDKVICYYQTVANMHIGQGSNANSFYDCSFAYAPIGAYFPGASVAVSMHGCAFEGFSVAGIRTDNAQITLHGGYIEMYDLLKTVVDVIGVGQVNIIGCYVRGPGAGYLATINGDGCVRYNNCYIGNFTYDPPAAGTYANKLYLRDNTVFEGTNLAVSGTVVGTFVPTLSPTVPGDFNVVYSSQYGRYRKDGNRIVVDIDIVTSTFTHSTASGYMRIQGLPFNATTSVGAQSKGSLEFSGITKAGYTQIVPAIDYTANQQIFFMASGSGVSSTTVNVADMPSGSNKTLKLTLSYETAY